MTDSKQEKATAFTLQTSNEVALSVPVQNVRAINCLQTLETEEVSSSSMVSSSSIQANESASAAKTSLFKFMSEFKALPSPVIRTLFRKIVEEVYKLHSAGSYHGDLTLEQIFIDQDCNISLTSPNTTTTTNVCDTFLDGVCIDLICLGEILFCLCFGSLPYFSDEDERYTAVVNGDWELFWTINEETLRIEKRGLNLSKSGLKELISIFLTGDSKSKEDLIQILGHEWMNGVSLSSKQVKSLLDEIRKKMQKII
jgi:serine/threonine protein kinase